MQRQIQVRTVSYNIVGFVVNQIPDICPICHTRVEPKIVVTDCEEPNITSSLQITFQCTRLDCQSFFFGSYKINPSTATHTFFLDCLYPKTTQKVEFSEIIISVSPNFVNIMNQVETATALNLDQIVGIGLRKALEFLIKDFAILQEPEKAEDIRKKQLAKCIKEHVQDTNTRECAKRATWLGNDETHYVRRWEDKDIKDLKILVRLTVNWIENVILSKRYIDEMAE